MDCFEILGISPTKDVKEIRRAYSTLLTQYSPEKDPEGFQRLRSAYEEALLKAKEEEDPSEIELSPIDKFMADFEAIYRCFENRLSMDSWKELLESEICYRIDTAKEVSSRILNFIMKEYNFPSEIWSLFNEHFSWTSKKDMLYNQYPRNFIDFVVHKINNPSTFNYEFLKKCKENEQDMFILEFRKIDDALEYFDLYTADKSIKAAQKICLDHPNLQILIGRYLMISGQVEEADKLFTDYISSNRDDLNAYFYRGELYSQVGKLEEACNDYKSALNIKPSSPGVWYSLGKCSICLKKYEEAIYYLEKLNNSSSYRNDNRTILNSAYNFYIDSLSEAYALDSLDSNIKYKLAEAYFKTSRVEESYNMLNELMQSCEFTSEMYLLFVQVLMAQRNMELAYTTVCKALDLYNDDYGLNFRKADILDELGRYEESAAQYNRTIEVGNDVSSAYNNKAYVLNKLERYDEALECADKAISLDSQTSQSYKNKAAALFGLGHYDDCLEACQEALNRYQYLAEAYVIKMKALTEINLYDDVLGAYNKAMDLGLRDARLYYEKARILTFRKQYNEAIDYCDSAIELDENNADFYNLKGLCNYYTDNYDEAIELFDDAIKLNKYYGEAYFYKAQSLFYSSRQNEALSVLDEAIALKPQHIDRFYNSKGWMLKNQKEFEKAVVEYKNAVEHESSSDKYYYSLGYALNEIDKYGEAIEYLDKSIELNPNNLDSYISKSYAFYSLGKFNECIECCNKAIELDPEYVVAHEHKGWALYKLKSIKEAEEELNIGFKLDRNNMNLFLLKLRILEYKNLHKHALIICNRMLELDENNEDAKKARAEILDKINQSKKKTILIVVGLVILYIIKIISRWF